MYFCFLAIALVILSLNSFMGLESFTNYMSKTYYSIYFCQLDCSSMTLEVYGALKILSMKIERRILSVTAFDLFSSSSSNCYLVGVRQRKEAESSYLRQEQENKMKMQKYKVGKLFL